MLFLKKKSVAIYSLENNSHYLISIEKRTFSQHLRTKTLVRFYDLFQVRYYFYIFVKSSTRNRIHQPILHRAEARTSIIRL